MKNLLTKTHPATLVASWFVIISIVAIGLTSCGTGYVSCDAYGDSGEKCQVLEDNEI
mgnify:CR=1 FL=1